MSFSLIFIFFFAPRTWLFSLGIKDRYVVCFSDQVLRVRVCFRVELALSVNVGQKVSYQDASETNPKIYSSKNFRTIQLISDSLKNGPPDKQHRHHKAFFSSFDANARQKGKLIFISLRSSFDAFFNGKKPYIAVEPFVRLTVFRRVCLKARGGSLI